ncbi:MAG: phage shock protein operon transcriptional activator [Gammaproteobacteria bacterium]|nr:phage shock protein operon transcriptional activator [Gammaproteobacteria bacterium]
MNTSEQNILGEAPEFLLALEHVSRAAPLSKPVLILGERGTGKELFASRLHYLSTRWDQPLVKVNCAALTESILESELFGHEAGAFTGAATRHIGRFERANNGTLLLDELGTIPQRMQEKILRVIEYGEFERVGGSETIYVDVRIIGATNADLPQLAARNKFRIDLLDRLAFDVINVPPLRHRRSDIELLANHFAVSITSDLERSYFPGFTEAATIVLNQYNWPGNVRELKNAVERSVYRNTEPEQPVATIVLNPFESAYTLLDEVPATADDTDGATEDATATAAITLPCDLKENVRALERRSIEQALEAHQYHQGRTAQSLSLTYHQLRAYLKKHDIRTRPE